MICASIIWLYRTSTIAPGPLDLESNIYNNIQLILSHIYTNVTYFNISRTFIKTYKICIAVTSKTSNVFKKLIHSLIFFFFCSKVYEHKNHIKSKGNLKLWSYTFPLPLMYHTFLNTFVVYHPVRIRVRIYSHCPLLVVQGDSMC